ncbi:hypothetical protein CK934_17755 [Chitinophaga sp. MD30]|nr:hypothetical protein CK934_17755 [Chitinophaga sp. MD30]
MEQSATNIYVFTAEALHVQKSVTRQTRGVRQNKFGIQTDRSYLCYHQSLQGAIALVFREGNNLLKCYRIGILEFISE